MSTKPPAATITSSLVEDTANQPAEGLAYVGGEVVDLRDARVPLNDRGYLLGDGVFETLRTSNGRLFRLEDHLEQLGRSAAAIGLVEGVLDETRAAIEALVHRGRNEFGDELYLRVNVTGGVLDDLTGDGRGYAITGLTKKFKPYPMRYHSLGVHVVVARQRKFTGDPLAVCKTLSFLPHIAARREALRLMAHDAILLNEHGRVCEATTSNIFARSGDTVYAPGPEEGARAGVTRAAVLELLAEGDFEVVDELEPATLAKADEAWLTNTVGGVLPITRYQDQPLGPGEKGDLTMQVSHSLEAMIRGGRDRVNGD